ncbi:hypothetical protein AZI86_05820 [Bdellovibrio bacteriovorus]|uniref:Cell division protein FtsX n=1 Tax=Bdellovibrio bacteriovorus TaxID=959 RepID=A0A150WPY6_BDEBC|nr:permease-like cell division protein FtsX [Bdellovibrio bacteriovorus]KYG66561.1 hypothetical protein AZI86_05820 [Bdellovibrio bacteriovorus]
MKNPRKNWALRFSTLVVVTACFVVISGALVLTQNFRNILTLWGEDVQMTVYLAQDLSDQGREFIENKIKSSADIEKISFVNQEKALGDFRTQMASYAPDISQDEELLKLIPGSFQVKLADSSAENQMTLLQNLASQIRPLEGVEEVSYGQDWIAKYAALISTVEITLRFLGIVILGAALFVISNAIRASIASRKEEIVVLEMIGATPSMIRKPFLVEGAILGLTSSVLAVGLCFAIYLGIKNVLIEKLSFLQLSQHIQFLTPIAWIAFVIVGTSLGALASYLCVRRINDGFAGSQAGY